MKDVDVDFDSRAATTARDVWLTFDDGPHPQHTPKVLEALSRANLKATFFMLGVNVEAHPRLVEQVFDAGHRIGNHSYSHLHLTELPEAEIREEIARTDALLAPYLGTDKLFRAPYGHTNDLVRKVAADFGYREVRWTVDPRDWHKDYKPRKWMDFGISQMKSLSSCVILLHDIQPTTCSDVTAFIAMIRQVAGVTFKAPSTL
jgi:peptidoglycan-N-acetylglucosamine deacetylase